MELYASVCVLSRRDAELQAALGRTTVAASWEPAAATLFLAQSARRIRQALRDIHDHDNTAITRVAAAVLEEDTPAYADTGQAERNGEGRTGLHREGIGGGIGGACPR